MTVHPLEGKIGSLVRRNGSLKVVIDPLDVQINSLSEIMDSLTGTVGSSADNVIEVINLF